MDPGRRLFRVLLRILPRDFRERNGAEMEEIAEELGSDRSSVGRVLVWLRASGNIVMTGARMRLAGAATQRRLRAVGGLPQDLGQATRVLRKRPVFTAVTAVVLGLGIGATTTIFSVLDGVLLRPLPYEASERIGILWHHFGVDAQSLPALNPRDVWDYRAWSEEFEAFTYGSGGDRLVTFQGESRITLTGSVEAGFFEFFGYEPELGRSIRPEDDLPEAERVAVLSHRTWVDIFGGDPDVLGESVSVGPDPYRIVGVLPPDFHLQLPAEALFLEDAEIWVPTRLDPEYSGTRSFTRFTGFGRIRPGSTFKRAQAELDRMAERLRTIAPEHETGQLRAEIVPLQVDVVKHVRPVIRLLFGAVALILLISCVNVANLLLARGHARGWELSVRAALGASRRRLFLLVFSESAFLSLAGGVLGVGLARVGVEGLNLLARDAVPRLDAVTLDGRVLLFAGAASILAAVLSGFLPALRAARGGSAAVLSGPRRSTPGRAGHRFRDGLVVVEVALTFVLLVGTGLVLRSFTNLLTVDPGYVAEGRLAFRLAPPRASYPDADARVMFYRELEERLRTLSGVREVSAVNQLPLTGQGYAQGYAYDEETLDAWDRVSADGRWVAPGYFRTLGAHLVAGREFTEADVDSGARVVIIDDRLARQAFPEGGAVGRSLVTNRRGGTHEIVGVVEHLRLHDLSRPVLTQLYAPLRFAGEFSGRDHFSVVIHADGALDELGSVIRRVVAEIDPEVAVQDVGPMERLVARARGPDRIALVLMAILGATAVALASVGLYGVLSFFVGQRRKEIGIRMALGQRRRSIHGLVVGRGMRLVALAVAIGFAASLAAAPRLAPLLFRVSPLDPATHLGVIGLLGLCAGLACWLPARRTMRIQPVEALRVE
ncbi:MAG: ABC transporter permease [Longimicrobiales bacterium]|nr:ABC transporter permease [Longimicrobiales bacterium]